MSVTVRTNADEETAPLIVTIQQTPPAYAAVEPQPRRTLSARQAEALAMAGMLFWRIGALSGAAAVALGAFGAHGLKKRIDDPHKLQAWATAAHYQLAHSVALLVVRNSPIAASLFTAGITMFSGSIYALTLDPERFRWMGPVTPMGGMCFIFGWLSLIFSRGALRI